jgi:arsenate reductase
VIRILHNPACSKSRRAIELLAERGVECEVVEYLRTPPDRETLERLLGILDVTPSELVRRDKRFAELGLADPDCASAAQVIELLLAHPELMERPVVLRGDRAVLARPPERLLDLLDRDASA